MWGQDWVSLLELFSVSSSNINLNEKLQNKNLTVKDMVKYLIIFIIVITHIVKVLEAEDFYTSLRLPEMTDKFWKFSIFEENENTTLCHGTAADLYSRDDFR